MLVMVDIILYEIIKNIWHTLIDVGNSQYSW